MRSRLTIILSIWLGALLAGISWGRDLTYFELGAGDVGRNQEAPAALVSRLQARQVAFNATAPGSLTWENALQGKKGQDQLLVVTVKLGTRFEVLALLQDAAGRLTGACRRPATSTFDVRLDRGQPGAAQGWQNAMVELAADIVRLEAGATPLGHVPLSVEAWPGEDGIGADQGLAPGRRQAVEALALAALVQAGFSAERRAANGALVLAVRWQAVMVDTRWQRQDETVYTRRQIPQGDLYPYLEKAMRKIFLWQEAVSDIQLVRQDWGPLRIVEATASRLVIQTGQEAAMALDAVEGRLSPLKEVPQPTDTAVPAPVEAPSGHRWAGAGLELGDAWWGTTSDGRLLRFGRDSAELLSDHELDDVALFMASTASGVVIATAGRRLYLFDEAGSLEQEHELPHRLDGASLVASSLWFTDWAGDLWRWPIADGEPTVYVEMGVRASDRPRLLVEFPATWPTRELDADTLDLDLPDIGPALLVPTQDGFLLTVLPPAEAAIR